MTFPAFVIGLGGSLSFSILIARQISARSKASHKSVLDDNAMRTTYDRFTTALGEKSSEVYQSVVEKTMRKKYMEIINGTSGAISAVFTKPRSEGTGDDSDKKQ